MAKINLGALAQDVRGSLAGTVFSKNRGGAYTRKKTTPVNNPTPRQTAQRAIFANASMAWRNLSAADQAAWVAWALIHTVTDVFGNALKLSGISAYQRINATLLTLGLPQVSVPPPDPGTPPPDATGITWTAATNHMVITLSSDPADGDIYELWTCAGKSPGARCQNSDFRLAGVLIAAATTSPVTVIPSNLNPLLVWLAGQNVSALVVRCSPDGVIIDSTRFDGQAA